MLPAFRLLLVLFGPLLVLALLVLDLAVLSPSGAPRVLDLQGIHQPKVVDLRIAIAVEERGMVDARSGAGRVEYAPVVQLERLLNPDVMGEGLVVQGRLDGVGIRGGGEASPSRRGGPAARDVPLELGRHGDIELARSSSCRVRILALFLHPVLVNELHGLVRVATVAPTGGEG